MRKYQGFVLKKLPETNAILLWGTIIKQSATQEREILN